MDEPTKEIFHRSSGDVALDLFQHLVELTGSHPKTEALLAELRAHATPEQK